MPETYWATLPPEELATEVMSQWKNWRRYFWDSGIGVKADKGRRYYFGLNDMGDVSSRVQVGGNQAQFLRVVLNKVRPLVRRSLAMVASQAPKMVPVAANSDASAREQAISAKGILEHFHREEDAEALDLDVLETAFVMGEAGRQVLWDMTRGEEEAIDPDSGEPIAWAGEFDNAVLTPFDMARDPSWRSRRKWQWVITRTWESRWEWAARYPEDPAKQERILSARSMEAEYGEPYDYQFANAQRLNQGDAIAVYRFFHLSGRAVPGGRAFTCLNNGTWLEDGKNPYKGLPVNLCTAGNIIATSMGYSDVFDALGLQDIINSIHTVITTHTIRWGTRPLIDFVGSGLQHSVLGNGASVLTVKDKNFTPQPLEVPPIPPEVFKYLEALGQEIVEQLGLNATAMGEPPFSGMPAQLAAILDQKAREYSDGLARSFNSYKQASTTLELEILKTFPQDKRIVLIQGKAKQWMLQAFSKQDLAHVSRVAMEPAPPGTGTMSFKFSLVEMLQRLSPEAMKAFPIGDLINLVRTGEFESPFEHEEANRLRIKAENEGLQQGKKPPVLMLRTHWLDIPEHMALLSSPDVTEKPEVVAAVTETVLEKFSLWQQMPAPLLALLGGPPPPMAMPVPGVPPADAPVEAPPEVGEPQPVQPPVLEGAA